MTIKSQLENRKSSLIGQTVLSLIRLKLTTQLISALTHISIQIRLEIPEIWGYYLTISQTAIRDETDLTLKAEQWEF